MAAPPNLNTFLLLQTAVDHHQAGRLDDARKTYERLLRKEPRNHDALHLLGVVLTAQGDLQKGMQLMRRAIAFNPPFPDALVNLSKALLDANDPESALAQCDRALALAPDDPEGLNVRGLALLALRRPTDALVCFTRATSVRPGYADASANEGTTRLMLGDFEHGWEMNEARWQTAAMAPERRSFSQPQWRGVEPLLDKRILLHAEQGLGDVIQFCRYAILVAARGARVILEVQPTLRSLLSGLAGVEKVISRGDPRPPFDLHCPLMSLPMAFATRLDTIPADIPYLQADRIRADAWRERLRSFQGLKVGLVWAGNPRANDVEGRSMDQRRSMRLDEMARLGEVPGLTFISLQKGAPAMQASTPPAGMRLLDWTADLVDFGDTAALVDVLDLVISVDTSVAHLAGALGKPVWLLNRHDACWRWLLDRDDSPWYPTMRLFTQSARGDWDGVMRRVGDALSGWPSRPASR